MTDGPVPEYLKIRRYILTLVLRAEGRSVQLPTVSELMERFGVSRPTVCKVMTQLAEDGYIVARPRRGFFSNPDNDRMFLDITRKPVVVGVIDNDGMLSHYMSYQLERYGHLLLELAKIPRIAVHPCSLTSHDPEQVYRDILQESLDFLVWSAPRAEYFPIIERLRRKDGLPVIINHAWAGENQVCFDYHTVGREAVRLLLEAGCRKLIFLPSVSAQRPLEEGLREFWREAGRPWKDLIAFTGLSDSLTKLDAYFQAGKPADGIIFPYTCHDVLFERLARCKPDFRETLQFCMPEAKGSGVRGFTYHQPLDKVAARVGEVVRAALAGENIEDVRHVIPLELEPIQ